MIGEAGMWGNLLTDKVFAVHLKDIRQDISHMFLKWDEVRIGEVVMDYDAYLKRLAKLPSDTPCFCEHFSDEADYIDSFTPLHKLSAKAGVSFLLRSVEDSPYETGQSGVDL